MVGGIGPHLLDTARWMFGDIVELSAHLATCVLERRHPTTGEMHSVETPDYSSALLTFDSGAEGIIAMSVVAWSGGGSRIEAYGSDGTLILDSFGRLWGAKRGDTRMTDISEISRDKPDSTAAHVGSLVKQLSDAIIGERQSVPEGGATFYDGLLVQELLDALRLSQNEKRRVRVSELARH